MIEFYEGKRSSRNNYELLKYEQHEYVLVIVKVQTFRRMHTDGQSIQAIIVLIN